MELKDKDDILKRLMCYDSSIYWDIVLKRETVESAIEKCKNRHGLKWTNEYILRGEKTGEDYVLKNIKKRIPKLYKEMVLGDHDIGWLFKKCEDKYGLEWMDKHIYTEKPETWIVKLVNWFKSQ